MGAYVDMKIKRVNKEDSKVIDFLIEESLGLYLQLYPESLSLWNGPYHDELMQDSRKEFIETISKDAIIYASYDKNIIIGCGFIDETGYLNSLFVKEEYRNQKIGTKILERLIQASRDFDIIRVDARLEAVSLYERFSFQKTGSKNKYSVPMQLERSHYGR